MTLENAVEAILEQGKAEANRVLEEARNERQRMLSEVRAEAAKALGETEKAARVEADRKRVQELARAEFDPGRSSSRPRRKASTKSTEAPSDAPGRSRVKAAFLGGRFRANDWGGGPGGKGDGGAR